MIPSQGLSDPGQNAVEIPAVERAKQPERRHRNSSTATLPPGRQTRAISAQPAVRIAHVSQPKRRRTRSGTRRRGRATAGYRPPARKSAPGPPHGGPSVRPTPASAGRNRRPRFGPCGRSPSNRPGPGHQCRCRHQDRPAVRLRRHEANGLPPPRPIDAQREHVVQQIYRPAISPNI